MSTSIELPERTLDNLKTLPTLPVPPLHQTCEKYIESVKPHLTEDELENTRRIVRNFRDGLGDELQRKLLEKAKNTSNWVKDWWLDTYLKYRGSIPFFSNIGGFRMHSDEELGERGTQIPKTALGLYGNLKVYEELASQKYPVTKLNKKTPLDMTQYYNLFSSGREPGLEEDKLIFGFYKDGKITMYTHIMVLFRRRFFYLEVLDHALRPLMPKELESQLYKVVALAEKKPLGVPVSSLTSLPRPEWKKARDYLLSLDDRNGELIDLINKAILVVAMDDVPISTRSELMKACLGKDSQKLWYDKGYTLCSFGNGVTGVHSDHALLEGIVPSFVNSRGTMHIDIYNEKQKDHGRLRNVKEPVEYEFVVDGHIKSLCAGAIERHRLVSDTIAVCDRPFRLFGRHFPKDRSIHPDAFFQMAIQLAFFRLHKKNAPTYETASTRAFYQSRTETLRSCTTQSVRWTRSVHDNSISEVEKIALLKEACKVHEENMHAASDGQGIDRHLFGLQCLAEEEGIEKPEIFKDKAWQASGGDAKFVLSTSIASMDLDHGCISAMVEDGYGVFYSMMKDSFEIAVTGFTTSKETNVERFMDMLHQSLRDMRDLLGRSQL